MGVLGDPSCGGRPLCLATSVFTWVQLYSLPLTKADLAASVAEYLTDAKPFIWHHPLRR